MDYELVAILQTLMHT